MRSFLIWALLFGLGFFIGRTIGEVVTDWSLSVFLTIAAGAVLLVVGAVLTEQKPADK